MQDVVHVVDGVLLPPPVPSSIAQAVSGDISPLFQAATPEPLAGTGP